MIFYFFHVLLQLQLKFNNHVKKRCKPIKINLISFRIIHYIPPKAAQLLFHIIISSFFITLYFVTVWIQTFPLTIKPATSLCKQALTTIRSQMLFQGFVGTTLHVWRSAPWVLLSSQAPLIALLPTYFPVPLSTLLFFQTSCGPSSWCCYHFGLWTGYRFSSLLMKGFLVLY